MIYGPPKLSCAFLASDVPKCQMSSGPYGPIFVDIHCVFLKRSSCWDRRVLQHLFVFFVTLYVMFTDKNAKCYVFSCNYWYLCLYCFNYFRNLADINGTFMYCLIYFLSKSMTIMLLPNNLTLHVFVSIHRQTTIIYSFDATLTLGIWFVMYATVTGL